MQANPYPLRLDALIMEKTKAIARENGRSVNKEIEVCLKSVIADYESKHGEIKFSDKPD